MFAKITEFRVLGGRVRRPRAVATHDADRRADCRLIASARRTRRPILTCRWHVVPSTGKLECGWQSVAASAIEEPGQKTSGRTEATAGACPRTGRTAADPQGSLNSASGGRAICSSAIRTRLPPIDARSIDRSLLIKM